MGRYTKPLDLYKAQRERFEKLALTRRQGHKSIADAGLEDAKDLTAGTLTPSQTRGAFARGESPAKRTDTGRRRQLTLRQMKRRGLPSSGVPLLPINMQSGKLHNSFRLVKSSGAGDQTFDVTQINPGGGIWRLKKGGTKKMVDSGFFMELNRRWRPRNKAFIDHYRQTQKRSS